MSTYKALVGKKIKSVSSDPSDSADGQMWYNTTTHSLRGLAISEAFSSGANLATARQSGAGAGTQTAGVITGGQPLPPGSGYIGITEEWDGSSWSESGDLNNARAELAGAGTQTATLAFGGTPSPTVKEKTESYNE